MFLVDGKEVYDDDGNLIKTKSAYKKFVKLQKIKQKKAANQGGQQQQKGAAKQAKVECSQRVGVGVHLHTRVWKFLPLTPPL